MTLRRQLLTGMKWTAGARLCGQLFTWGITLIVMRLLAPSDYGLLAEAGVFVAFLIMLSEAGLGPALVQRTQLDDADIRRSFGLVIVINAALIVALNVLAPVIAAFFREPRLIHILQVLSLQFVIICVSVIPDSLMKRRLAFKQLSLIDLATAVIASLGALALAASGYGVWSLVISNLLGNLVRAIILNRVSPVNVAPSFSLRGMRRLLVFGGNVTGARILWFLFVQSDVVIVGRLLGSDALGIYSIALHLASLPVQRVSAILNQVIFPVIARYQDDHSGIRRFVTKATGATGLLAFPLLWGLSCTAPQLVAVILGSKWEASAVPLQLIALVMPLRMLVSLLPSATDALGRPDVAFRNALLSAIVMPLAFIVGARWNVIGVALAWLTVYPLIVFFNTQRMLAVVGLKLRDVLRSLAPAGASALLMYAAVSAAEGLLVRILNDPWRLAVMILVGAVVYISSMFVLNRDGFREMYSLLKN